MTHAKRKVLAPFRAAEDVSHTETINMATPIVQQRTGNSNTFVPAVTDFEQGKRNYRDGKRISSCTTDEMTHGWLAQEEQYRRQYWTEMAQ